jgi:threonine dehydratase
MFTGGGLADAELGCDEDAAHAVLDEVAVDLRGEMGGGCFEPGQDLEPAWVGEGAHDLQRKHLANLPSAKGCVKMGRVPTTPSAAITPHAVEATYAVIKPHVRLTPVVEVNGADFGLPPFPLVLKLEHLQNAGSFKTRGAFANLLMRDVPPAGVVAASGGNHGTAVAYAAMRLGVRAKIFVPTVSSPAKISRIRDYGAELVVGGDRYADALAAAEAWATQSGAMPVHAFDQLQTLLGQATIALELAEQAPTLDTLLVAVGGGGLIGGIAAWYAGRINVIGVEPDGAPTLSDALHAGHPVDAPTGSIAADSLAPRRVGELMFPIAQHFIDRAVLVTDAAIREAQQALWSVLRLVVEPGGAAALSALLSRAYAPQPGERVGVLLSGANTTAVDFDRH